MGFSDSPMRIDQPTIYEVLHTQPSVQVHAETIMHHNQPSHHAVWQGRGLLRMCLCPAHMVCGAVCCRPSAFCAAHAATSCSIAAAHHAALLNIVHAMANLRCHATAADSFLPYPTLCFPKVSTLACIPAARHQPHVPSASANNALCATTICHEQQHPGCRESKA